MIVSVVALVISMGGSSYAAFRLARGSVGTRQLRNGAVTGAKIRNGAITGRKLAKGTLTAQQIDLGKLGTVPSATHALTAGSATTAGSALTAGSATTAGTALSAGTAANGAQRMDFIGPPTDPAPADPIRSPGAHAILAVDEMTVRASCIDTGGGVARVYVSVTSPVSARLETGGIQFDNPSRSPSSGGFDFSAGQPTFSIIDLTAAGPPGTARFFDGTWLYRNQSRTISLTLHVGANDNGINEACDVLGTAVAAPS